MSKGKLIAIISSVAAVVIGAVVAVVVVVSSKNKNPENESYRTIKVFDYAGEVIVNRNDSDIVINTKGMNLKSGDTLSTSDDSSCALKLDEDKYIYIKENTTIKLYASGTPKNTKTSFYLEKGSLVGEIQNKLNDEENFDIYSANSVMSIHGTAFSVSATEKDGNNVVTYALYRGNATTSVYEKLSDGTYKANTITQEIGQKYEVTVLKEKALEESELKSIVDKVNENDFTDIKVTDNNSVEDANSNMDNTSINGAPLTSEEKKDIVDVIDDIKQKADSEETNENKDLVIYSFYGDYDGENHSITLGNADEYKIKYSIDNKTFVDDNYSFKEVGFYIVYVQALEPNTGELKSTGYGTIEIIGLDIIEKEYEITVDASLYVKASDLELPEYEGLNVRWTNPDQELDLGLNFVDYTVSGDGYYDLRATALISCNLMFDYSISSKLERYDGRPHSLTVNSDDYSIIVTYSIDGVNYTPSCPEFVDAGEYVVFIKIVSGKRTINTDGSIYIDKATIIEPETYTLTIDYVEGMKLSEIETPKYDGFETAWENPGTVLTEGENLVYYIMSNKNYEDLTCSAIITATSSKAKVNLYVAKSGLWNDSYVLIDNTRVDNYSECPVSGDTVTLTAQSAPGYRFLNYVILNEYGEELDTIFESTYELKIGEDDINIKANFTTATSISTNAFTIKYINEDLEETWMGSVLDEKYSYTGGTIYPFTGGTLTMLAVPYDYAKFIGWYKLNGEELTSENLELISKDDTQSFTVNEDMTIYAMFGNKELEPFYVAISSDGYFTIEGDDTHYNYKEFNTFTDIVVHLNDGVDFNGNAWVENGKNKQYLSTFKANVGGNVAFSLLNPTYTVDSSFTEETVVNRTCNDSGIVKLSKGNAFEYRITQKYYDHEYEIVSRIGNCFDGWNLISECKYCGNIEYSHESSGHNQSRPTITPISEDYKMYTYTCEECGFKENFKIHNAPAHKELIKEGTTITLQNRYETSDYTWSRYYWNESITKVGGNYYIEVLKKDGASGSVEQQYLYVIEPYNDGYRVYKRENASAWGLAEYEYEADIIDIFNTHVYSKLYKGMEFFNDSNTEMYFDKIEYLPNEILTISDKDYNCEVIRISSKKFYFYEGMIIQMSPDTNAPDYYASSYNESVRINSIYSSTEISSSFDGYSNGGSDIFIQIRNENASPRVYLNGVLTYPKSGYGWYYIENGQTLSISGYVGMDGYTGFHFERFDVSTRKWVPFYPENNTFEVSSSQGFAQYKIVGEHPDTVTLNSEIADFFYDYEYTKPIENGSEVAFGTLIYGRIKDEYRNSDETVVIKYNDTNSYVYDYDFTFTITGNCNIEFYVSDYKEDDYIYIEWSNYGSGYMTVNGEETEYLYIDEHPELTSVTLGIKDIYEGYEFDGWYIQRYEGDVRQEILYSKDPNVTINLSDVSGSFNLVPKFIFENGAIHTIKALNGNILLVPVSDKSRDDSKPCYYYEIGINTVTDIEIFIEDDVDGMQLTVNRNGRPETMSYYEGVKIYDVESDTTVEIAS